MYERMRQHSGWRDQTDGQTLVPKWKRKEAEGEKPAQDVLSIGYRPTMAEDGKGPGLPEVAKVNKDVGELIGGLESLAVGSGGFDADSPPTSKKGHVLFVPQPPTEECPLCLIPLPRRDDQIVYPTCCGNMFCGACYYESERVLAKTNAKRAEKKLKRLSLLCPFCRTPAPTSDEGIVRRLEKRAEKGDSKAVHALSSIYRDGDCGLAKDMRKFCELVHRAADLGDVIAIAELGGMYAAGVDGVSLDEPKGRELLQSAAKKGNTLALINLGALEARKGRAELGLEYLRTAAAAGDDDAVKKLWKGFRVGGISKDYLEKSLRAHQEANENMRSEERERLKRWMKVQEKKKQEQAKA